MAGHVVSTTPEQGEGGGYMYVDEAEAEGEARGDEPTNDIAPTLMWTRQGF